MTRPVLLALALACSGLTTTAARADVVGPCPPGFQASHSGCHFGPSGEDLGLCGACACAIAGLGGLGALLLVARRRESGSREGPTDRSRG